MIKMTGNQELLRDPISSCKFQKMNNIQNEFKWNKKGLIIKPNKSLYWSKTHAMVPTPQIIDDGLVKIFYSGRDQFNRSHIGYSVVDLKRNCTVIESSQTPLLSPGELGCFDDNGVTPSCVINLKNNAIGLYYIGWNPGSTVRMHIYGGLAISKDGGQTFDRWSRAPILERNRTDPYLNTAPWVVKDGNQYRIFYVSGKEWLNKDTPRYNIKTATSLDGLNWDRKGQVAIDFKNKDEDALARPYVVKEENIWKMWFSYKGGNYKIGYAESSDGEHWVRLDNKAGIDLSSSDFDSEMIEYAAVVSYKSKKYMFYNGNNYGYDGIGLAISE